MTIQIPNPGTGNGASGDNEFVLWSKVKSNFEDQTNAASRLVGIGAGNVMQVGAFGLGATTTRYLTESEFSDPRIELPVGAYTSPLVYAPDNRLAGATVLNMPRYSKTAYKTQLIITASGTNPLLFIRTSAYASSTEFDVARVYSDKDPIVYNTTTASGANVAVDAAGKLMRSTSSERYKDILAPLELDDAKYADAMALKPIVYRSTADADNPAYHYYSFSAEELGAYDPAFTLWRDTETVTDADGNITEQPLAERQAEGININALLAMSHAIAIKQDGLIKDLQEQINALKQTPEV